MKNILAVTYFPKEELSNTKKVFDEFLKIHPNTKVLELSKNLPEAFNSLSINSYIKRNYLGEKLNNIEQNSLLKLDKLTSDFKEADLVVFAFPMHNFSLPGAVKSYFDNIILKGETFDIVDGKYIGLCKNKKALVLITMGGTYEKEWKEYDHASTLSSQLLNFMGISDVVLIKAGGLANPKNYDEIINTAKIEITNFAKSIL